MVDMREVSLVADKTTAESMLILLIFPRICLLPHSSLGLSRASFSNYLKPYNRCFADPFLRERSKHKSNYSPGAQSDPFRGLL